MPKKDKRTEVLERVDPDPSDGEHEIDGDPRFEFALADGTLPADQHPVWVSQNADPRLDCVKEYKHKGYREVRYGEGVLMKSGMEYAQGEVMSFRDHILMVCDSAKNEARETRERSFNDNVRARMIKKANAPIYVTNPSDR